MSSIDERATCKSYGNHDTGKHSAGGRNQALSGSGVPNAPRSALGGVRVISKKGAARIWVRAGALVLCPPLGKSRASTSTSSYTSTA